MRRCRSYLVLLAGFLLMLSSCSIQKRHYLKGFYVSRKSASVSNFEKHEAPVYCLNTCSSSTGIQTSKAIKTESHELTCHDKPSFRSIGSVKINHTTIYIQRRVFIHPNYTLPLGRSEIKTTSKNSALSDHTSSLYFHNSEKKNSNLNDEVPSSQNKEKRAQKLSLLSLLTILPGIPLYLLLLNIGGLYGVLIMLIIVTLIVCSTILAVKALKLYKEITSIKGKWMAQTALVLAGLTFLVRMGLILLLIRQ